MLKSVGMESTRSSFIKARQRGQQALSALALHTTILFSKQTLQNVCRHGMVFGSVNKSLQIEHVTSSSSTSCKKSLIIQLSSQPLLSHMTRYFLQRRPLGRLYTARITGYYCESKFLRHRKIASSRNFSLAPPAPSLK